eukprot:COSAG04_NODE_4787_length_1894_cov_1.621170_1_plen_293_part_10
MGAHSNLLAAAPSGLKRGPTARPPPNRLGSAPGAPPPPALSLLAAPPHARQPTPSLAYAQSAAYAQLARLAGAAVAAGAGEQLLYLTPCRRLTRTDVSQRDASPVRSATYGKGRQMFSAIRALRSATRLGARRITTSSEALGLGSIGVGPGKVCHYNLRYDEIAQHEDQGVQGRPAVRSKTGAICVDTGKFTGRSPSDKYVVLEDGTRDDPNKRSDDPSKGVWWGEVNQEMDPAVFDELYGKVQDYYNSLDEFYVFDGYCGANPDSRRSIRFLGFDATQHHFVKNMFIRPDDS